MSLKRLLNQGRLTPHKTSRKEIANLIDLARRDIKDAELRGLSLDRKKTRRHPSGVLRLTYGNEKIMIPYTTLIKSDLLPIMYRRNLKKEA